MTTMSAECEMISSTNGLKSAAYRNQRCKSGCESSLTVQLDSSAKTNQPHQWK